MPKERRRRKHTYKVLLGTFVVFTAVLFGGTLALPYLLGLRTLHIPASASIDFQPWMELVPSTADTLDFTNVSYAISQGYNTSVESPILDIYQAGQALTFANITYLFSYGIPATNPNSNETGVDIFKVPDGVYNSLQSAINASSIAGRQTYRSQTIYQVLNNVSAGNLVSARIAFYNGSIFYTQGTADLNGQIDAGLDVALDHATSLFSNRTVQLSVYAVAGNGTDYMALHYIGYSAEIPGANYAAKAIVGSTNNYSAVYAFGFNSSAQANSKAKFVTTTYQNGLDYYLLDNYVVAKVRVYPEALFIALMAF
jgi:hypothetical protein